LILLFFNHQCKKNLGYNTCKVTPLKQQKSPYDVKKSGCALTSRAAKIIQLRTSQP